MPITISNPRTREALRLLSVLATPAPPFMQPFEEKPWMEKQVAAFRSLYVTHQDNKRVVAFLSEINGASRMDSGIEDAVWRARNVAVRYMEAILQDIDEELFAPSAPSTGDPATDLWAKNAQVIRSDGFGSEWKRAAVREQNKRIEYEIGFTGYVQERRR